MIGPDVQTTVRTTTLQRGVYRLTRASFQKKGEAERKKINRRTSEKKTAVFTKKKRRDDTRLSRKIGWGTKEPRKKINEVRCLPSSVPISQTLFETGSLRGKQRLMLGLVAEEKTQTALKQGG